MASITKRAGKWTVTARLPDSFTGPCKSRSISNTFKSKRDAQLWIDATESAMRLGKWKDPRLDPKPGSSKGYLDRPFKDALDDYRDKITPEKKGADQEVAMLNMLAREDFASKTLRELSVDNFVTYRDARKEDGKAASTIRNNLNTVSAVYEWLIHEKSIPTSNPIASLRKRRRGIPQPSAGRDRRLRPGEEERIWSVLTGETWQNRQWQALFPVLVDTGMRAGEVRSILAGWVRREYGFIVIPEKEVKGNEHRYVALSERAYRLLLQQAEGEPDDATVFKMTKNSAEHEWQKIREAAGCPDLRIHDLRHEALSRMAATGADLKTLMRQSGHKTVAVLMRYLNPTKEEQRTRLFGVKAVAPAIGEPTAEA
ncbi:integrase [Rhizobium sp. Root73]|uniref:tyrosine-type recombinase/integrase n=1 Tax=unclassified Rhizobium TaxID=2613769 RepID=UPI00072B854A|nr:MULTISPECIES: site-specific integrase [unclassified Rhizobium]KQY10818.1 integrase [Rhizobium sp. Root1334]KRC04802.1 integrase [Rhizobium sp. Root73]